MKEVRLYCEKIAKDLWEEFEPRRRLLLSIARNFYPPAVPALRDSVETINKEQPDYTSKLLTTIPLEMLRRGASGFQVNITSPARQWFRFCVEGLRDNNYEINRFLDNLKDTVAAILQSSGVYTEIHKLYYHLLAFNFACMLVLEDNEKVVRAITLRPGTYALGVGADGRVDKVARKFAFTRAQLIEEFGLENLPREIREAKEKSTRRWVVHNLIEKNDQTKREIAQKLGIDYSLSYRSIYWIDRIAGDNGGIIKKAGFVYNPIIAPRFIIETGETYGVGRGEIALPLARGLQTLRRDQLEISGNRAEPAIIASADFQARGISLGRGAINYVRFGDQPQEMVYPVFKQQPDSNESRADFDAIVNEMSQMFFVDAFATIDSLKQQEGVKTATEVSQLVRENMMMIGPVVSALDRELLDPLLSVVALYAFRSGRVQLPAAIASDEDASAFINEVGAMTKIEYLSQIHLAQKSNDINATNSWLQLVSSIAQFKPEVLDLVNADEIAKAVANIMGVPSSHMNSEEEIKAFREARAQQLQAEEEKQQQVAQAEAIRQFATIPTDSAHGGSELMKVMKEGTGV